MSIPIPGKGAALGVRLQVAHVSGTAQTPALLRAARPGDRIRLRHSSGTPKRVKEILERLGIAAPDRAGWPVLEWQGEIVWMRGAGLEPTPRSAELTITHEDAGA